MEKTSLRPKQVKCCTLLQPDRLIALRGAPGLWPHEYSRTYCSLLSLQIRCLCALELGLRVKCSTDSFETAGENFLNQ